MKSSADTLSSILTFGLVFASFLIPILIESALGGWKFGSLLRRVDFVMDSSEWPAFYERLHRRLMELGFTSTANGEFVQRGQTVTELGAFTHAKTPKKFSVTATDAAPQIHVQLTLQYLDGIVADTGESAFRDAVLAYVSGQSDEMKVVANRSYLAVCAFAGGILAWLTLAAAMVTGLMRLLEPVYVLGITYTMLGGYSVFAILRKPEQTIGLPWAISGTIACILALLGAAGFKVLHS